MVSPILVLGLERNGTTWLQNILCNHSEVVGAQHRAHWGIKESYVCSNILYWNDFKNNDDFIDFLELYSSGDYFKLVEGDKDYFYQHRPKDFIDFFFDLMDNYAKKQNVRYWITKLDSLFYRHEELLDRFLTRANERYDEIKFIGIKRDHEEVLMSYLNWQGRENMRRRKLGFREIYSLYYTVEYGHGYNSIYHILNENDGMMIRFNQLKQKRSGLLDQISTYLDIESDPELFEDRYPPNSSYLGREKRVALPEWEKKLMTDSFLPVFQNENFLNVIFKKIIDSILHSIQPIECPLYWRLIKLEKLERSFIEELDEKERIGLKRVLLEQEDREENLD